MEFEVVSSFEVYGFGLLLAKTYALSMMFSG